MKTHQVVVCNTLHKMKFKFKIEFTAYIPHLKSKNLFYFKLNQYLENKSKTIQAIPAFCSKSLELSSILKALIALSQLAVAKRPS